jgi:hypothetical protein
VDAVLRPLWTYDGRNGDTSDGLYCAYGLASQSLPVPAAGCRDQLLGSRKLVGHAGEAYNLRSGLWIDPAARVGIAYFAANTSEEASSSAYSPTEAQLASKLPAR